MDNPIYLGPLPKKHVVMSLKNSLQNVKIPGSKGRDSKDQRRKKP